TESYTLFLHDALPIWDCRCEAKWRKAAVGSPPPLVEHPAEHVEGASLRMRTGLRIERRPLQVEDPLQHESGGVTPAVRHARSGRSEEHTSELQSRENL